MVFYPPIGLVARQGTQTGKENEQQLV